MPNLWKFPQGIQDIFTKSTVPLTAVAGIQTEKIKTYTLHSVKQYERISARTNEDISHMWFRTE